MQVDGTVGRQTKSVMSSRERSEKMRLKILNGTPFFGVRWQDTALPSERPRREAARKTGAITRRGRMRDGSGGGGRLGNQDLVLRNVSHSLLLRTPVPDYGGQGGKAVSSPPHSKNEISLWDACVFYLRVLPHGQVVQHCDWPRVSGRFPAWICG